MSTPLFSSSQSFAIFFKLGRALLACAACVVSLSAAPAPGDPLPVDPQLRMGKLANGLSYYIQKNATPAQRVELRLVLNAGSILEDDDQRGAAHFVEHLAFNGSTHFRKQELKAYLQSIGMRAGADLNAFTGFDSTYYILPLPTDKPENLGKGLLILEDWAHGVTMTDEAIEDERKIILEEKRLRYGYVNRTRDATLPTLANGSRYKDRLAIGTEESIATNRPEALRRFYRDWYRPDLMAVIVVGDIDPDATERMVRQRFGQLKMPASPRPRPQFPLPPLGEPNALVYADREAPGSNLQLVYATYRRAPSATAGEYRDGLVRRLFAQLMGARMARQPVQNGFAGEMPMPFGANQRMYAATAAIGPAGVHQAIDVLVGENQRVRQFGFSESELDLAKRSFMARYEHQYLARDTRSSRAVVEDYQRHFLAGEPLLGIEQEIGYVRTWVPGVTLDEVNAYARTIIPAEGPRMLLYTTGTAQPAPTGAQLLATVQTALTATRRMSVDKAVPTQLAVKKPEPGAIVAQVEDKELGVTRLVLSNGVKVVLKPTPFSKDSVQMSAARPGGQMLFADADRHALRFAGALNSVMGAGPHSQSDLRRILAGKNLSFNTGMSGYADHVHGGVNGADLETLLQLNYLAMTAPRRDKATFRSFVNTNAELALTRASMPEARFGDARNQAVYGGHPRVELRARPEDYRGLDMDRTLDLFRSRMDSAKGMTFFFVGDFEVDTIKPLLATWVATLPVGELPLQYRDPGIRQVAGVTRREFRAGTEQKSVVSFDFGGDVAYSKDESMAFLAMIDVLNIRIKAALRDRHQLIYAGEAVGKYGRIPRPSYSVSIGLPTAPQNVEKLESTLWAEIAELQDNGPAPADLDKAKQAMLQTYRKSVKENSYWRQRLESAELEGDDPRDILTVERRLDAVTPAQVQAAARRFLDRERYVEMVLKPEA
ncbi:insulinase family protein [Massilia sp. IC2-477]|uniref:M16 family metallopeptidase n=1 Tax=Massilia sp. IC2-477 TaxID=2887198 RepID=UPI001D10AA25|nr:M16 family metallopeptidase [Massilia sp. IC2-477]MCC2954774.1 insulinase family protein [Massilia sp. IC2-477]